MLDMAGSLQLLHAPHVRERDKALLRSIMVGGVLNGILLGHARGEIVPCIRWGWSPLLGMSSPLPLVQIRENPEFHGLIQKDKRTWPRCLLWQGWLHALDGAGGWAVGPDRVSGNVLENCLGGYRMHGLDAWAGSQQFATGTSSGVLAADPDVRPDGCPTEICCGGAGVFALFSGACWFHRSWAHLDLLPPDETLEVSGVGCTS